MFESERYLNPDSNYIKYYFKNYFKNNNYNKYKIVYLTSNNEVKLFFFYLF
jgi:hypothetical protein